MESLFILVSLTVFLLIGLFLVVRSFQEGIHRIELKLNDIQSRLGEKRASENRKEVRTGDMRLNWRAEHEIPATLYYKGAKHAIKLIDISKTGALVESPEVSMEVSEVYDLEFQLPGSEMFKIKAKCVRQTKHHDRFGCSFQDVSLLIRGHIESLMKIQAQKEIEKELGN